MVQKKNIVLVSLALGIVAALFWANRATPPEPEQRPVPVETQRPASPSAPVASAQSVPAVVETQRIPHFYASLEEAGVLPKILPASQFDIPIVARAYKAAARIPKVLAQQPCYCWCEKIGHGSLLDCFATDHGAG